MDRRATAPRRSLRAMRLCRRGTTRCDGTANQNDSFLGLSYRFLDPLDGRRSLSCGATRRLVEQELADQFFDDDRRLRLADAIAVLEHYRIAARIEPDVHLAQKAGSVDRRDSVLGELILVIDAHGHDRVVGL